MKAVIFEEDSAIIRTFRQVGEVLYERILLKTHFIKPGEDMVEIISRYAKGYLQEGDVIFVSDKALANSQQRAIHIDTVKPGFIATFLSKYVYRSAAGPGIGSPQKMQVAIEQVGLLRVLLAAFLSAITKVFGIRGVFYKIVGEKVRGIDGMSGGPKAPYWKYIILPSGNSSQVAQKIFQKTGCHAIVADINDLDGYIMGYSSDKLKETDFVEILRDNPMGQASRGDAQTPIGIIRVAQAAVSAG